MFFIVYLLPYGYAIWHLLLTCMSSCFHLFPYVDITWFFHIGLSCGALWRHLLPFVDAISCWLLLPSVSISPYVSICVSTIFCHFCVCMCACACACKCALVCSFWKFICFFAFKLAIPGLFSSLVRIEIWNEHRLTILVDYVSNGMCRLVNFIY